ncbi:MAG: hypothetical protein EOO38_30515 [Cytophagaceae bacterium]|nr:MAG: hypothetical protein EOO38_30515 [Cytophagaceae bacterium]
MNHQRHVQPFVRMLSRGFEDLGDQQGWQKVKEWDKGVKKVLLERQSIEQDAIGREGAKTK